MYMSSVVGLFAAVLSAILFFGCHLIIALMAYAIYLNKRDGKLETEEFKKKYGDNLTEGLTMEGFWGTYWNI